MRSVPKRLSAVPLGVLMFVFAVSVQSCKESAAERYQPLKARAAMTDAAFRNLILDKLESDEVLKDADLHIRASSRNGKVTVSGKVPSEQLRVRAVDLVKSVDPDMMVTDEIVVSSRS